MRLELTRSCDHYPLKVACIPISPPAQCDAWLKPSRRCKTPKIMNSCVPRTGLEPARLSTYAPETYASTNSATWASRSANRACRRATLSARLPPLSEKQRCTFFLGLGLTLACLRREPTPQRDSLENESRTWVLLILEGERQTRLELATPTLARSCSTN